VAPVAWRPAPAPALEGPLARNDRLGQAEIFAEGIPGPEDIAFDDQGRLYTGLEDGRIVRFSSDGSEVEEYADTGGRPLGLQFDPLDPTRLIVADARKHLIAVNRDRSITVLATEAGGTPFRFVDDLDIARDGTIYFSDASSKFGADDEVLDLLEHGGHGRLLAYHRATGETEVLLDGLQFANGVALGPDDAFVLVAESGSYRVTRYWLKGPEAGRHDTFADNLPGFPDNINRGPDGIYWLALPSLRVPVLEVLADKPFWRKVVSRLPAFLLPGPVLHGVVLGLDDRGDVVRNLQDPSGRISLITSAMARGEWLYLGSFRAPRIARVRRDAGSGR
jgi:sugar lactone lactonase YvrE